MWEDQSKCKQRTVGTGFTVLRGGGEGGRGGGFNILGQSIIRAVKKAELVMISM